LSVGTSLQLPDEAARHVQVLRMQPGDSLCLFNGLGGSYSARVVHMGKHTVDVEVLSHELQEREALCATHIAVGMPANERMDWLVEKATELGVAHITPLSTQHTVLRLSGERALKRQAHWQGIAQAACAQSGRNRVPQIDAPPSISDWLKALPDAADQPRVLLSFQANAQDWRSLWATPPSKLTLLSGPEGGLSAEEEAWAVAKGFVPVHLGPRVLRAETAPLAVLAQLL
jgi:16S rRNA (uracil1498-N3)-methyltransferase